MQPRKARRRKKKSNIEKGSDKLKISSIFDFTLTARRYLSKEKLLKVIKQVFKIFKFQSKL